MFAFSWPLGWLFAVAVRGIATRSSLPLLCVAVRIGQRAQRVTPVRPYRRRQLVVLVVIVLGFLKFSEKSEQTQRFNFGDEIISMIFLGDVRLILTM